MISYKLLKKGIISLLLVVGLLACDSKPKKVVRIEGNLIEITPEIEAKASVNELIQPYKDKVEKEMNTVLCYTPIDLVRTDGELESSLGNLIADLCVEKAQPIFNSRTGNSIDFALFNYGGIRAGISKGEITNENAFQLMPFENYLVVAEMTPSKIKELVEYLISRQRAHPVSKNFRLHLMEEGYDLQIKGEVLNDDRTYFVLTTDYLQNLGDNMNHFKDPVSLHNTDYKMRNAIIDYFKETDTISVALDGRFKRIE